MHRGISRFHGRPRWMALQPLAEPWSWRRLLGRRKKQADERICQKPRAWSGQPVTVKSSMIAVAVSLGRSPTQARYTGCRVWAKPMPASAQPFLTPRSEGKSHHMTMMHDKEGGGGAVGNGEAETPVSIDRRKQGGTLEAWKRWLHRCGV